MAEERRQFERIEFREPIEYTIVSDNSAGGSIGFDISEGGLRFHSTYFIPLGTEVTLNFILNDGKMFWFDGTVAWIQKVPFSESYHVGINFQATFPTVQSKGALRQYIVEHQFN